VAAIDFPNSPSLNDTFTASGTTWVWNGTTWKVVRNSIVGPTGPSGKTILSGFGIPDENLGTSGDFYYDINTTRFYGPKLAENSWAATNNFLISNPAAYAFTFSWEIAQVQGPVNNVYVLPITHNLGFYPNVTVKLINGDVLETGVDYNSVNEITLTMAQPFSGTAYLS
jgi:hypothetical protein